MADVLSILANDSSKTLKPYSIFIELTYRCNLRCIHCYIPSYMRTKKNELTFEEIKSILDQSKRMGIIFVGFTGGEIFARKDIFDILRYAYQKNFIIRLKSNGSLITKKIAEKISRLKIQQIDITFYGLDQKIYKIITGNGEAFKKTRDAIFYLKKYGVKVRLQYTILKENIHLAERMFEFIKKHDLQHGYDYIITPMLNGDNSPLKHACFNHRKLFNFVRLLEKFEKKQNKKKTKQEVITTGKICQVGYAGITISPFGDIRPCTQIMTSLGNIRIKKIRDVWYNSVKLNEIRSLNDFKNLKECQVCNLIDHCRLCLKNINCMPYIKKYAEGSKIMTSKMEVLNDLLL